jgi:NDP-4-keto-2,6-dideoxyhexose 3-C-methyltransferase
MFRETNTCRICSNPSLVPILHLGTQSLTGVFPRSRQEPLTAGPLELVKCAERADGMSCGLVQLHHSYESEEMYGQNYGYRSALNQSMVTHLHEVVKRVSSHLELASGDLVLDIGSNDSTLLQAYPSKGLRLVGIDPTGRKFQEFYPPHIQLVPDFFSAAAIRGAVGGKRAKVISSIAMLYDLEDPLDFFRQVHEVLDDDGLWVFEQSYLPAMLRANAYDTVCHEHLEYYGLKQIKWMTDRLGFVIVDVELNNVNGGSFCVTVARRGSRYPEKAGIAGLLAGESELSSLDTYAEFRGRVFAHREALLGLLDALRQRGAQVLGYGASTKGNVILQFCGLTERTLPFIAEVNPDKFGRFTPGTGIPIISEAEARRMAPDFLLVLPWHFRENLVSREKAYLGSGGKLIFPLPTIDVIGG